MRTLILLLSLFVVNVLFAEGSFSDNPSDQEESQIESEGKEKFAVKVLCYNIRFGELASLEEIADFIKSEQADIVALQELDINTNREGAPHQNGRDFITELAYHSGLLGAYAKTIDYSGGYYGIGILSKYPFKQIRKIMLPMPEGAREQRAVLIADVELPEGKVITFASTHLDHSTSDVRKAQVQSINDLLKDNPYPVVVSGDFNARPDSPEIKEGMKEWGQACPSDFTSPANSPKNKIDYIFYFPIYKWEVEKSETPVIKLSDHLPITANMILVE